MNFRNVESHVYCTSRKIHRERKKIKCCWYFGVIELHAYENVFNFSPLLLLIFFSIFFILQRNFSHFFLLQIFCIIFLYTLYRCSTTQHDPLNDNDTVWAHADFPNTQWEYGWRTGKYMEEKKQEQKKIREIWDILGI